MFHGGAGGAVWQESQGLPGGREHDRAPDALPARASPDTRRGRAAAQSWYVQVKICTVLVFYLYDESFIALDFNCNHSIRNYSLGHQLVKKVLKGVF